MKKLLLLLSLLTTVSHAQEAAIELDLITDTSSAEEFLKTNKNKSNKLIVFNEEKHKSVLAKKLLKLPVGGTTTSQNGFEKTTYKVVEKNQVTHYRLSYILLDRRNKEASSVQATINQIISDYDKGTPFDFLAKKFSDADNATRGGDSGWFIKEDLPSILNIDVTESQYIEKELYTLENDKKGLYYIILNTYKPKEIKEIKALKVVEPRS
ncbi:peptidylprolyl isomerase [Xanthomarina sp. F1114]|uniref:peptidylprolyl isomerase n=1 Tax=Xanthomarina sp. F1114 TaxID=2996019 RepID=UPI00225DECC9|nr:peptidylprolyl isomerase [Xanthomarina sp. F1114]MCX7548032.1 peptidylprolyl isomerase [Xanthomarina sp. F1114]